MSVCFLVKSLSYYSERSEVEDVFLLCHDVACRVFVRLPCAHLDERIVRIAEVNHQEEIALVLIAVGLPQLFQRHAVDVVVLRVFYYFDV